MANCCFRWGEISGPSRSWLDHRWCEVAGRAHGDLPCTSEAMICSFFCSGGKWLVKIIKKKLKKGVTQTTRATPKDLSLHQSTAYLSSSWSPLEMEHPPSQLYHYVHILYSIFFICFIYFSHVFELWTNLTYKQPFGTSYACKLRYGCISSQKIVLKLSHYPQVLLSVQWGLQG